MSKEELMQQIENRVNQYLDGAIMSDELINCIVELLARFTGPSAE